MNLKQILTLLTIFGGKRTFSILLLLKFIEAFAFPSLKIYL